MTTSTNTTPASGPVLGLIHPATVPVTDQVLAFRFELMEGRR
jgi:hypothetical protein